MAKQGSRPGSVLCQMRRLLDRGELEVAWRDYPNLVLAACECFGSWSEAIAKLHDYRQQSRKWSKERCIEELVIWNETNQANPQAWMPPSNKLRSAAKRFFGSFHDALDTLNLHDPHRWTRKRIIDAIQNRYIAGLPINERENRGLYCVARRKFGSWLSAVHAAGLAEKPRIARQKWTQELVIRKLNEWSGNGRCLYMVRHQDYPLFMAAKHHFGTWRNAIAAAGLESSLGKRIKNNERDA